MAECSYMVSTTASHVVGKRKCNHIPRYTIGGREFCARHATTYKAEHYALLVRTIKELLYDCDADLKPTRKHPARMLLRKLGED